MGKKKEPLWELRGSSIHQQGMFARKNIPAGTRIIEYVGELISKEESERRCIEWEEKARKKGAGLVYVFDLNEEYDLDGNTDTNPAKYINHSCEENCEAINEEDRIFIYSTKDIAKDAELSFDYGYELEHFIDHPCLCGSKKCVGYIVTKSSRKKLKEILRKKEEEKKSAKKKKKSAGKKATTKKKKKSAKKAKKGKKAKS
ncbi:MAG: SET domain-containing protein-lysine N-methyltransferase [Verrucomicrobiota bacterium]